MFEVAEQYGRARPFQKVRRRAGPLLAVALTAAPAWAQDSPSAEETAAARTLAHEGIRLADAGLCEEAIDKLVRAEKLYHAPVVLGRLGECLVARGKLVEGTETLRRVLREPLPPNPPAVLLKAHERAQSVLDKAKGRIGALNIGVKGPSDTTSVVVSVDGDPMNVALLEIDRPTDPGEHLIEARAPGFSSASARVSLGPGARQIVNIELVPDPNAVAIAETPAFAEPSPASASQPPAPAASPPDAPTTESAPKPEAPNLVPAYVAWGVSGVLLGAGTVLGIMALDRKGDLEDECSGNVCPESARDHLDSARGIGTLATLSFIGAGAALGVGTFLYFNATSDSESEGGVGDSAGITRAWIGVGSVGVSGAF
jgi:hypothetical protein